MDTELTYECARMFRKNTILVKKVKDDTLCGAQFWPSLGEPDLGVTPVSFTRHREGLEARSAGLVNCGADMPPR